MTTRSKRFSVVVLVLLVVLYGLFAQPMTERKVSQDKEYLQTYFQISPLPSPVSGEAFGAALQAIASEDYVDETAFTPASAIASVVKAAGYDELAQTYSVQKASSRLALVGITGDDPYLACAVDAGVVDAAEAKELAYGQSLSGDLATELLMSVAEANGKGRNILGYSDDPDIGAKIAGAFSKVELYGNSELDEIGAKLVESQASTGYGLKREADDARFLPSLTLRYGHDSEKHAKQLIALLNSEGIRVAIQIEPKTSIYQYMLEWGPYTNTPTYRVEKYSDDLYLVHAIEYDMEMEFASKEDLLRFNAIMERYSKKNDENQKEGSTAKLISGAWWQPLYSASFKPNDSDYAMIYDNILYSSDGAYSIHPFTLPEGKDALQAKEAELSGRKPVSEVRYVDNAFYRYLTGTDHQ
ncbi:MAG: hypothetical protein WCR76_02935 [Sphaerochaetaceae bacterium]|jgi:hypothetical protein